MTKKKNKTPEELKEQKTFKHITDSSTRSEKVSWNRKLKKMEGYLDKLRPIEDKILELHALKVDIFDEIQILRNVMIKECIHPKSYLVQKDDHIECKFCNKKIGIPSGSKEDT